MTNLHRLLGVVTAIVLTDGSTLAAQTEGRLPRDTNPCSWPPELVFASRPSKPIAGAVCLGSDVDQVATVAGSTGPLDLISSTFRKRVILRGSYAREVKSWGSTFLQQIRAEEATFEDDVDFESSSLLDTGRRSLDRPRLSTFAGVKFLKRASFSRVVSEGLAFYSAEGRPDKRTTFESSVSFAQGEFNKVLRFSEVHFEDEVSFEEALVSNADFSRSTFERQPRLTRARFRGELKFEGVTFKNGLDLRTADLKGVTAIYLDRIAIAPDSFKFEWSQLRNRIRLSGRGDPATDYGRLAATYELLAASLDEMGATEDADEARFDLERQRASLVGNAADPWYGFFLGYGYQPWRIVFLVIPVILVFAVVFMPFNQRIAERLNESVGKGAVPPDRVESVPRIWYVVYFSTAVLLGVRYDRNWIDPQHTLFTVLVTIEWVLGLAIYVAFFALVRTAGFAYVKGLLGF